MKGRSNEDIRSCKICRYQDPIAREHVHVACGPGAKHLPAPSNLLTSDAMPYETRSKMARKACESVCRTVIAPCETELSVLWMRKPRLMCAGDI